MSNGAAMLFISVFNSIFLQLSPFGFICLVHLIQILS